MSRSLADLTWPRTTARLSLRPARVEDAPAIFAYRRLPEVAQWITRLPTDAAVHAEHLAQHLDSTLVVERDGVVIGDLMLRVCKAWSQAEVADQAEGTQAELGWAISPEVQGQGLGTEAVRELIAVTFDLGVRRVEANCFADNEASWRLMERVGMRREGHYVKESLHRDGTWRDGMTYALLAEEWIVA
jgi:RimJ/RimL family protein N-acetyltransferase